MFKFTIRELLLLTLVVALGVGWWVDREHQRSMGKLHSDAAIAAGEEAYALERIMLNSGFKLDRSIEGRITVSAPDGDYRNWPARMKRPTRKR